MGIVEASDSPYFQNHTLNYLKCLQIRMQYLYVYERPSFFTGPLTWYDEKVKKWKLIGVVSHGEMEKDENGCVKRDPEHPSGCGKVGVYAEVTTVLDWVQSVINGCKGKGKIKGQRLPIRGHDG